MVAVEIEILSMIDCEVEMTSNGRKKNVSVRKTQARWIRSHRKCNHDVFVSKGAGDRERSDGG